MFDNINKILILSPHTDDAELGCGATICRFIEAGKEILWIVFSSAEESLPTDLPPDTLVNEFKNVVKFLGLKDENYTIYNFKVRKLFEKRQEVLEQLINIRNTFKPDLVIGPSLNDFHQDHIVVAYEMIRAFKTSASIICYELPWNHVKFETQSFFKIDTKCLDMKIEILKSYKSQLSINRNYFSEEFIKGIACTRGSQIGEKYAEAFEVIRWVI